MATRYKLAPQYKIDEYLIDDTHFDLKQYDHILETTLEVYQCRFVISEEDTHNPNRSSNTWVMERQRDISDNVIDYSCSYTDSDNICMSGSLTLKVPTYNVDPWYGPREIMTEYHSDVEGSARRYGIDWGFYYYELVKVYRYPNTGQRFEYPLGYFKVTNTNYSIDSETGTVTLNLTGLSCTLQAEYGGNSKRDYVTKSVWVYIYRKNADQTIVRTKEKRTIKVMLSPYIPAGTMISNSLVYQHIMGSWADPHSVIDMGNITPAIGAWVDYNGQMIGTFYQEKEFDADCSRADVMNYMIDTLYIGGRYWIDEYCFFRMRGQQNLRRPVIAKWKDYGSLFISESISYNDSGYYNDTIVRSEVKVNDVTMSYLGEFEENDATISQGYRVKIKNVTSLQSDQECKNEAAIQTYRSMWGKETITVELQDAYIFEFVSPSLCVGCTIEYQTTYGYTTDCTIKRIQFSDNKITLELVPFKPLYPVEQSEEVQNNSLGTPIITGHEIIQSNGNYYIRLYVDGDDIDYGFLKVFRTPNTFIGESCKIDGQGRRYADVLVDKNGVYGFCVQLASPFFESSGWSGNETNEFVPYEVVVNNITVPAQTTDPDPYPHPNIFEPTEAHNPYLLTQTNGALVISDNQHLSI